MSVGKYSKEERRIADKIHSIKCYLNTKKGTPYPLNKKDEYERKINILKQKLNGKYKEFSVRV